MPTGLGTLTPPDTWSCPFPDLHLFDLSRPATPCIDKTLYQFVTLLPNMTFLLNLTFYQILVSIEHLQRVWHADRGRFLPPDTWSYPIWDLHLFIKPKQHYLLVTLTEYDLFTEIYITELERFQQNICNGCGMPAGDADSSGHLVPSLWDLHMFYLLRPILLRTCHYFTGLCSSNIPRYFLDFAWLREIS